eukprot:8302028-Pyramimonas_sp.AAC.1
MVADARGQSDWGVRWRPHVATRRRGGRWLTHAGGASGTFGGAPCGATKRCTGWWLTHAGGPTGAVGGAPYGATER